MKSPKPLGPLEVMQKDPEVFPEYVRHNGFLIHPKQGEDVLADEASFRRQDAQSSKDEVPEVR